MDRRRFITSTLAISAAAANPRFTHAQTPVAPPAAPVALTRVEVDGEPIALSPDGTMIAGIDNDEAICVWDASTHEQVMVSEPAPDIGIIDRDSLTWSPDSSAVAWSFNANQLFIDSDIFVFDLASGTTANLTTDKPLHEPTTAIGHSSSEALLNVDICPAWSPDSTSLAFARTIFGVPEDLETRLCVIPREGGTPTDITTLSDSFSLGVMPGMTWNEDDTILYSTRLPSSEIALNGIFRAAIDGTGIETVSSGLLASTIPWPLLVDVSPGASLASVIAAGNLGTLSGGLEEGIYFLVDLRTGIPSRFEEVLSLPIDVDESLDAGLRLDGAPAIMTNDGGETPTFIYATLSREHIYIRSQPMGAGNSTELAIIERQEDETPRALLPSFDVASNGTFMLTHPLGTWISTGEP